MLNCADMNFFLAKTQISELCFLTISFLLSPNPEGITGKAQSKQHWNILWEVQTYFERLQETGISQLHSIGPFSAFCIPEIAPEGFPVIILYLQ